MPTEEDAAAAEEVEVAAVECEAAELAAAEEAAAASIRRRGSGGGGAVEITAGTADDDDPVAAADGLAAAVAGAVTPVLACFGCSAIGSTFAASGCCVGRGRRGFGGMVLTAEEEELPSSPPRFSLPAAGSRPLGFLRAGRIGAEAEQSRQVGQEENSGGAGTLRDSSFLQAQPAAFFSKLLRGSQKRAIRWT